MPPPPPHPTLYHLCDSTVHVSCNPPPSPPTDQRKALIERERKRTHTRKKINNTQFQPIAVSHLHYSHTSPPLPSLQLDLSRERRDILCLSQQPKRKTSQTHINPHLPLCSPTTPRVRSAFLFFVALASEYHLHAIIVSRPILHCSPVNTVFYKKFPCPRSSTSSFFDRTPSLSSQAAALPKDTSFFSSLYSRLTDIFSFLSFILDTKPNSRTFCLPRRRGHAALTFFRFVHPHPLCLSLSCG